MPFEESPASLHGENGAGQLGTLRTQDSFTSPKPQPPFGMGGVPRWGLWRAELRDGKLTKVPHSARTGRKANVNDPADWTTHDDAYAAYERGNYDGLGFALGPDGSGNYWQGIDLDNIAANHLEGLAAILPGYVEVSPSGGGLHAIGYGGPFRPFKHFGVEAYCEKRFFTFTGARVRGELCDLAPFNAANIEPHRPNLIKERRANAQCEEKPTLNDEQVERLAKFYEPDTKSFSSSSEADLGFCKDLLRQGCTRGQTETAWLGSRLGQRDKTQRRANYRQWTLDEAYRQLSSEPERVAFSGLTANGIPVPNGVIDRPTTPWISAGALRDKHFEATAWVVPKTIPQGLTIFGGRPKLGKSWAALEMALAVAEGGETFGHRCESGDVLYCALEDTERRLKSRMWKLKGAAAWPSQLNFICNLARADEGGVELARDWLKQAANPRLLIIDTLAKVRPNKARDEGNYDADYRAVTPWKDLADEFNVAVVLVHHVRKLVAEDPLEMISGTNGLTGAADAILILNRSSQGCTLGGRGRDLEEFELAIGFNPETCRWNVLGNAADVQRSHERNAIVQLLSESAEPLAPKQIAARLNASDDAVRQMLLRMVEAGEAMKAGRGRYCSPSHDAHNGCDNVTVVTSLWAGGEP